MSHFGGVFVHRKFSGGVFRGVLGLKKPQRCDNNPPKRGVIVTRGGGFRGVIVTHLGGLLSHDQVLVPEPGGKLEGRGSGGRWS